MFEVLPALHRDKSTALIEWLGAHEGALPFYFGDDANDEVVYPSVRACGGIAVAVGRTASRAEYALAAPGHVIWFLEWLMREWREIKGSGARVEPEPPVGNADEVRVPVSAGN